MSQKEQLEKLRKLLLEEDRELYSKVTENLDQISALIHEREKLESKVNPIIEDRLEQFGEEIPKKMGPAITAALKVQISNAQNEVVDLLYPIIGKLISKFIRIEIQRISDRIDEQLSKMFSFKGFLNRLKHKWNGTSEADVILRDTAPPLLEELFIVEKGSGILIDSYSKNNTLDQDMIAGMLTAIKAFVEDAFAKGSQELEVIEYESYKIHVFNFQTYYIALVISGIINAEFLLHLQNRVLSFAEKYKGYQPDHNNNQTPITALLKEFFNEESV